VSQLAILDSGPSHLGNSLNFMTSKVSGKAKKRTSFLEGTWHIYEMEQWDEDYFNMEASSYIRKIVLHLPLGELELAIISLRM
jgi:hypothetical protein